MAIKYEKYLQNSHDKTFIPIKAVKLASLRKIFLIALHTVL